MLLRSRSPDRAAAGDDPAGRHPRVSFGPRTRFVAGRSRNVAGGVRGEPDGAEARDGSARRQVAERPFATTFGEDAPPRERRAAIPARARKQIPRIRGIYHGSGIRRSGRFVHLRPRAPLRASRRSRAASSAADLGAARVRAEPLVDGGSRSHRPAPPRCPARSWPGSTNAGRTGSGRSRSRLARPGRVAPVERAERDARARAARSDRRDPAGEPDLRQ